MQESLSSLDLPASQQARPRVYAEKNLMEKMFFGTAERTLSESINAPDTQLKPHNPDDLWQKTGSFEIYEEMLKDDQVDAAVQIKQDLVVGSGGEIVAEDDGQEEIIEDLERALNEDPEVPFESQLEQLLPYKWGFSVAEKIFKKRPDGSLTLRKIKTPHPDSWEIHTDRQGNVTDYFQIDTAGQLIKMNPSRLIHVVNRPEFQNPYGRSDLRSAYSAYFAKRHVLRYYAVFLENAAGPKPVAKYDQRRTGKTDVDTIFNTIKKLQNSTAMTVPNTIDLEYLESKSNPGEAYISGIHIFNMFIGRALMLPDLIGFTGDQTQGGSFSLGEHQIKIFLKHIERRRRVLEQIVNRHIIRPLVVFNHGFVDNFPKFQLKPISDDDAGDFAKIWIEAQKSKLYKPSDDEINHFKELIKFPKSDEIERPEDDPAARPPPTTPPEPGTDDNAPEDEDKDDEPEDGERSEFAFRPPVFKPAEGDFSKKVDFQAVETQLNSVKDRVMKRVGPIIDEIFESLFDQVQKKKIISGRKVERIDDLKVPFKKKIQTVLKSEFREHWKTSQEIARNELFKSDFAQPLPSDEFLEFLESETFQFVGDWDFKITSEMGVLLREAIKDGRPLSSVIPEAEEEIKSKAQTSVERFSRTKGTEVMNRARLDFFDKSGVISGYQFSAILDDRTTPICAGLHEKTFKAGREPVPPLHFNCRSILVPITKFESFTPSKSVGGVVKTKKGEIRIKNQPIEGHIEEFIGKGFSKK